eukprot:m.11963 g.11963  ORF g.11963 m.11963 type:complete len:73 (+) comp7096_c0_seq1:465-683(+)
MTTKKMMTTRGKKGKKRKRMMYLKTTNSDDKKQIYSDEMNLENVKGGGFVRDLKEKITHKHNITPSQLLSTR